MVFLNSGCGGGSDGHLCKDAETAAAAAEIFAGSILLLDQDLSAPLGQQSCGRTKILTVNPYDHAYYYLNYGDCQHLMLHRLVEHRTFDVQRVSSMAQTAMAPDALLRSGA